MRMKYIGAFVLIFCSIEMMAQDKNPLYGFVWTFSPLNNAKNRMSSFSNDSISIETIDSVETSNMGFEFLIYAKKIVFLIGFQPNLTLIGDRDFRLRYNSLLSNQVVSTDELQGHFETGSFFFGIGRRYGKRFRHTDFSSLILFERKTGRFIIHDDLYQQYLLQSQSGKASSSVSSTSHNQDLKLSDLTQEIRKQHYISVRQQASFAITRNRVHVGVIGTIGLQLNYMFYKSTTELITRNINRGTGGLSFSMNAGIGMALGDYGIKSRKKNL